MFPPGPLQHLRLRSGGHTDGRPHLPIRLAPHLPVMMLGGVLCRTFIKVTTWRQRPIPPKDKVRVTAPQTREAGAPEGRRGAQARSKGFAGKGSQGRGPGQASPSSSSGPGRLQSPVLGPRVTLMRDRSARRVCVLDKAVARDGLWTMREAPVGLLHAGGGWGLRARKHPEGLQGAWWGRGAWGPPSSPSSLPRRSCAPLPRPHRLSGTKDASHIHMLASPQTQRKRSGKRDFCVSGSAGEGAAADLIPASTNPPSTGPS